MTDAAAERVARMDARPRKSESERRDTEVDSHGDLDIANSKLETE